MTARVEHSLIWMIALLAALMLLVPMLGTH